MSKNLTGSGTLFIWLSDSERRWGTKCLAVWVSDRNWCTVCLIALLSDSSCHTDSLNVWLWYILEHREARCQPILSNWFNLAAKLYELLLHLMQTGCILTWIYGGLLVCDRLAPPAGLIDWSIDTILQLIVWPQTVRWCQIFTLLADAAASKGGLESLWLSGSHTGKVRVTLASVSLLTTSHSWRHGSFPVGSFPSWYLKAR